MPVQAMLGLGARIYDSLDGVSWTEMIDMQEIGSPDDPEVQFVEATPVNPTARAHEYLAGLINYGEFEWKQYLTGTRLVHHRGNLARTLYYKVVLNDAISVTGTTMIVFGILVKATSSPVETEKVLVIHGKVKVTGATSVTPAS